MSGTIPDSLGDLASLWSLSLWGNQLSGSIPDSLGRLTSLYYLYLSSNQLSGSIPDSLGDLANLWHLSLWGNQLSGSIPDRLGNLTNLRQLSLSRNQLTGGIPASLGDLTQMTSLYLNSNQLSGPVPDLSRLTSLQQLYLWGNQLDGPIPDWLGDLTDLQELSLSSNQFTGEIPAALGNLTELQTTRFAYNLLTGCVPLGLRDLVAADDFAQGVPAHDFIAVDANRDGDTYDDGDIPGLHLPFCMLGALALSDGTLVPAFAGGTAAYTADVANSVDSTTVTATLPNSSDRLSIRKGTASYRSGAAVPLAVGPNEITVTVTPTDRTPTLTYSVNVFRAGVDRETLIALYNSTGGASWTDKTNWLSATEPIDEWFGVEADSTGNVTKLELSGNNLRGTLPVALGSLTELNVLDLSGNQLRGPIPDARGLTGLTSLNFGDNQLSGTIPGWLSSLTRLQDLSLRDNRLTGPIPAELGDLRELLNLYLNGNQLSGCVPGELRAVLINHDFFALDANGDGDAVDPGDTPGLPFCTLSSLAFTDDVTLNPEFTGSTTTYTASAPHDVALMVLTAMPHNSDDTISIMKGAETFSTSVAVSLVVVSVLLDVGPNVLTITVTPADDPLTPHIYTVTVTRAPNAPPAFDEGAAATRGVVENTAAGENIGDPVAATDADDDTLTYSLDAAGAEFFDIDASSGQLRTKAGLDFEDEPRYTVTVSVHDGKDDNGDADEVTDDTITVTILVADMNEAPEFPSSETGMRSVDENTPAGEDIGAPVAATDDDNDTLTYSLDATERGILQHQPGVRPVADQGRPRLRRWAHQLHRDRHRRRPVERGGQHGRSGSASTTSMKPGRSRCRRCSPSLTGI